MSKRNLRYVIRRSVKGTNREYFFALVDTKRNDLQIAGSWYKSPIAPQWLRDKQGVLNTRDSLDE